MGMAVRHVLLPCYWGTIWITQSNGIGRKNCWQTANQYLFQYNGLEQIDFTTTLVVRLQVSRNKKYIAFGLLAIGLCRGKRAILKVFYLAGGAKFGGKLDAGDSLYLGELAAATRYRQQRLLFSENGLRRRSR